ncbi:MAG: hypothetical protein ABI550_08715 [Ignavibacteriaceae bacterium]
MRAFYLLFFFMNMNLSNLKSLSDQFIYTLISSAAASRKEKIYRYFLVIAKERKLNSIKIYELLLQNYLFAGFPSALNSLKIFNEYFPNSKRSFTLVKDLKIIGEKNCRKIYGEKFEKLISNINEFSPELSQWLIEEGYGKVFGRKSVSLRERELSIISVLSVLKFENQLYSHINGAYRLKINLKIIEKNIKVLDFLGNRSYSRFGLKVLHYFKNDKISNKKIKSIFNRNNSKLFNNSL